VTSDKHKEEPGKIVFVYRKTPEEVVSPQFSVVGKGSD
jgi:hypothetical protein